MSAEPHGRGRGAQQQVLAKVIDANAVERFVRGAHHMDGEVREWLKRAASKAAIPERVSGVRIPPSPPENQYLVLSS